MNALILFLTLLAVLFIQLGLTFEQSVDIEKLLITGGQFLCI